MYSRSLRSFDQLIKSDYTWHDTINVHIHVGVLESI